MSFGLYSAGFAIVIIGLAYAAHWCGCQCTGLLWVRL